VPRSLAQRLDGSSSFPTLAPDVGLESQCVGTLPPDNGPRTVPFQSPTADVDVRPVTAPVAMPKDVVSRGAVADRPRSAPMLWITAMTDRVNALWDAFYGRRRVVAPIGMTNKDLDVEKVVQREERPSAWHDALAFPITTEQPQTRRLWRLDSDVEIDLDRTSRRMPSPELDLAAKFHYLQIQ